MRAFAVPVLLACVRLFFLYVLLPVILASAHEPYYVAGGSGGRTLHARWADTTPRVLTLESVCPAVGGQASCSHEAAPWAKLMATCCGVCNN